MLKRIMCWFNGHQYDQVESYSVEFSKAASAEFTIKKCSRCGHSVTNMKLTGKLPREVEAVIKNAPSKAKVTEDTITKDVTVALAA